MVGGEIPVERSDWYRKYPMKIVVFRYNAEIVTPSIPPGRMIAAAPDGTPPRRIGD